MNTQKQAIDMGFTKEQYPDCHHICLIYDNEEQRRKIVSEYIAAGLRGGEIVRYFADTTSSEEIHGWLSQMGIDAEENDSFRIIPAESSYCPSGSFIPQQVLDNMMSRYTLAKDAGYSASRACGEMSWVLRDVPGSDHLLEYEVGINTLHPDFPFTGMCQYDARRFDGATLFKVLQVHPYMIAQGQLILNPFYIKPEEFHSKLDTHI
jgi:hypothetical protein